MNAPIADLLENKDSDVHTVPSTATVLQAVQTMINARIGSVLVVEGERLVGIFTERDVLVRVVGARMNPDVTPVSVVMTSNPVTVDPATTMQEVLDTYEGRDFRHLPVVENGRIVGIVSFRDIIRFLGRVAAA